MSLKAGRVGVAPDQVDNFGKIKSDATSGYTKQEADAKFETQTHAASTYETKTDAAALQPIQLSVPIELLVGTALTVEDALKGINDDFQDSVKTEVGALTYNEQVTLTVVDAYVKKVGKIVDVWLRLNNVTFAGDDQYLAVLPEGFRPSEDISFIVVNATDDTLTRGYIDHLTGNMRFHTPVTNKNLRVHLTFII